MARAKCIPPPAVLNPDDAPEGHVAKAFTYDINCLSCAFYPGEGPLCSGPPCTAARRADGISVIYVPKTTEVA